MFLFVRILEFLLFYRPFCVGFALFPFLNFCSFCIWRFLSLSFFVLSFDHFSDLSLIYLLFPLLFLISPSFSFSTFFQLNQPITGVFTPDQLSCMFILYWSVYSCSPPFIYTWTNQIIVLLCFCYSFGHFVNIPAFLCVPLRSLCYVSLALLSAYSFIYWTFELLFIISWV